VATGREFKKRRGDEQIQRIRGTGEDAEGIQPVDWQESYLRDAGKCEAGG
jgi:hypothetical protein